MLLPTNNIQRVTSKRVDYGFCLQSDNKAAQATENMLASMTGDIPSVSQSATPMLRKRPLFCNIEIKKPYGGQDPGPQLGVWCCAGLTKMANLSRGSQLRPHEQTVVDLPPIPCWTVDGHRWQLYVARRRSPSEVVCLHRRLKARTLTMARKYKVLV